MYRGKVIQVYKLFTDVKFVPLIFALMLTALLGGCSQKYKSSWKCSIPEGIGCSSVFYADMNARKHIILNEDDKASISSQKGKHAFRKRKRSKQRNSVKLLIKQHYSDFKKVKTREVAID